MKDVWLPFSHQAQRFSPDDNERCGFLVSRRYSTPISLVEVLNVHEEPASNFRILPDDYQTVIRVFSMSMRPDRLRSVVGVWHTHPGCGTWEEALPSASDLLGARKHPYLVHAVYHPFTRRLTIFAAEGIRETFHLPARWIYRKGT